jgi:hypothetical protein
MWRRSKNYPSSEDECRQIGFEQFGKFNTGNRRSEIVTLSLGALLSLKV